MGANFVRLLLDPYYYFVGSCYVVSPILRLVLSYTGLFFFKERYDVAFFALG